MWCVHTRTRLTPERRLHACAEKPRSLAAGVLPRFPRRTISRRWGSSACTARAKRRSEVVVARRLSSPNHAQGNRGRERKRRGKGKRTRWEHRAQRHGDTERSPRRERGRAWTTPEDRVVSARRCIERMDVAVAEIERDRHVPAPRTWRYARVSRNDQKREKERNKRNYIAECEWRARQAARTRAIRVLPSSGNRTTNQVPSVHACTIHTRMHARTILRGCSELRIRRSEVARADE